MKNSLFILICWLAYTSSLAQKTLNIHKSNFMLESFPTSSIDSIRFTANETVMRIYFENTQSEYLLAEIDSVTATNSYLPTEGTIDMSQTVTSRILGGRQPYTIYLPPSYHVDTRREYPVLYLLHGLGQNYTSWATDGNLKAIADRSIANGTCEEIIIVSPEAYASFYVNGYDRGMNYEDYFINDFIPAIESTYRIKANKEGRSIAGLSMGGYGCTYHAFKRPEMFNSCFAMSAAFTGTYPPIGPLVTERTAAELLEFPAFVMECGTEDFGAYPMNNNLNRILEQTTLDYTYTTRSGRHDWAFWRECLPKALKLASESGNRGTQLKTGDYVRDIVNHPAFNGFGELLLARDNNASYYGTRLSNVASLMPYHGNVRPDVVVSALNRMIDEVNSGKTIFYDIYTEQQKQQNPAKRNTGIFFFRGTPGAPFAIVCPGGGFSYVGSLHEGFPLAKRISELGLNAFVIRYRIGSEQYATEDLAAAIAYIFRNAPTLGVSTNDYALWGGSAGARMAGNIALSGVSAYGGGNLPKPATAVIAYTGQTTYASDFSPAFITVAANDGIANVNTVERRVENLRNAGVDVEYRRYQTAGHGFGLGTGTDAEGWLDLAVRFWQRHIKE